MKAKIGSKYFKVYCFKCKEQMTLINKTISRDLLIKRVRLYDLYKCKCGCMQKFMRIKVAVTKESIDESQKRNGNTIDKKTN